MGFVTVFWCNRWKWFVLSLSEVTAHMIWGIINIWSTNAHTQLHYFKHNDQLAVCSADSSYSSDPDLVWLLMSGSALTPIWASLTCHPPNKHRFHRSIICLLTRRVEMLSIYPPLLHNSVLRKRCSHAKHLSVRPPWENVIHDNLNKHQEELKKTWQLTHRPRRTAV